MKITKRLFGTLKDGAHVHCWTMENDRGLRAELLDYGATIRAIEVPARGGRTVDVVLGYDTLEGYTENGGYLGATIGRFGNRIGGGAFTLNGKTYTLARNNGENHLHGGQKGFDKYVWDAEQTEDGLLFSRVSPDGEEGYPGTLTVSVRFSWKGDALSIRYHAVSDRDTILNLTNHSYFNLDGEGTVQEQLLCVNADAFTPNDAGCLPLGVIAPVAGTAMDFRTMKPIGRDADRELRSERGCAVGRGEVPENRRRNDHDDRPARRAALHRQRHGRTHRQARAGLWPPQCVLSGNAALSRLHPPSRLAELHPARRRGV